MTDDKPNDILERRRKRLERLAAKRAEQNQNSLESKESTEDVEKEKKEENKEENTNNEIMELEQLMKSVMDTNKNDMAEVEDSNDTKETKKVDDITVDLSPPSKSSENVSNLSPIDETTDKKSSVSERHSSVSSRNRNDTSEVGRRRSSKTAELKEKLENMTKENERKRRSSSKRSSNQQLSDILASANSAGILSGKSGSRASSNSDMSKSERRRSRMEDIEQKLQEVRNRRESQNLSKSSSRKSIIEDSEAKSPNEEKKLSPESRRRRNQDIEERNKSVDNPELIALRNRISKLVKSDEKEHSSTSNAEKRSSYLGSEDAKIKALLSKRSSLDASLIKDIPSMISSAPDCDQSMLRRSFQISNIDEEADKSIEYPENTDVLNLKKNIREKKQNEAQEQEEKSPINQRSREVSHSSEKQNENSNNQSEIENENKNENENDYQNDSNYDDYNGNYQRLKNNTDGNSEYKRANRHPSPIDDFMRDDIGPQDQDEFWESMIGEFKDYFMDIPSYVLQKIRNGIPHQLRGRIWKVMSGADNDHLDHLYEQLLLEESPFEKQIIRDVTRTFPHMSMFSEKNGRGQTMLFNLMKAYSLYDTEVGYCQGLCFIVGPLLMQKLNEKEAFSIFVRMMDEPESKPENELEESTEDTRQTRRYAFRSLFTPRMPGVNLMMYQFDYFLKTYLPALYGHLLRHNVVSTMYASQWFLTIFAYNFPLPLVFRIFDILLAEGPGVTILRFSIAILRRNQSRLLEMESFEEILEFLKGNKIFEIYGEGIEAHNDVVNDAMSICNIICETELRRLRQDFERTDDANHIANHGGEMELLSARMTLRELRQQRNYDHNLIEELKTQIEVLSEEVNDARRDVDPLRDENESLRVQCHELKEMLTNEDRKLQSIWEDAVRKLEQENLQLKNQLSTAEGQLIDAKVLMANMEDEKEILINSIEALRNAFGANEVTQVLTASMKSSSMNQSQNSIRRSDSIASNRSQGSILSNGNSNTGGGWFNNVSSAISNYMEKSQRHSHSQSQSNISSSGSIENMDMIEEPNAANSTATTQQPQNGNRWKFGWK